MILIINLLMWAFVWDWPVFVLLLPANYLADTWLTWVLYGAIMGLQDAYYDGRIPEEMMLVSKITLGIGLFQDFFYNQTWAVIVFGEFMGWKVTDRLKYYVHTKGIPEWMVIRSRWYAEKMLNWLDRRNKWKHV